MKALLSYALAALAVFSHLAHATQEQGFSGKVTAIGSYHDGQQSWSNGGLGRLYSGDADDDQYNASGELQLGYRQFIGERFEFAAHVQGRTVTDEDYRDDFGVIELKGRYLQPLNENNRLLFTVGQFFLPTSMENKEAFWDSPYTITYSSLNSWIGEEFRPIGLDLDYKYKFDNGNSWQFAGTAFQSNDTMATLLAWRGWSYNRHRSSYDEVLYLPDLVSLSDSGSFYKQQDVGTRPFGQDLDDNIGYSVRTIFTAPGAFQFKLTGVDNNGDQLLYDGEYAWNTRFIIAGFEWQISENFIVLSEIADGNSLMGPNDEVDIDFYSSYLMGSWLANHWRYSLRYDTFEVEDNDSTPDDNNADEGDSVTFAVFYEPAGKSWNIGAEIMHLQNERYRATVGGPYVDEDITQFSIAANFSF